MDKVTIIEGKQSYDKYLENISLPIEKQRMLYYSRELYDLVYYNRKETDTHIYWSQVSKKPKMYTGKLFYKHTNDHGITYDKKTKTLKIWFGHSYYKVPNILIDDVYKKFKINWVKKLDTTYTSLINNTIFKNIVKGKITNKKELCQAYLKVSPYKHRDVDVNLFIKATSNMYYQPKALSNYFMCAKDCNVLLQSFINKGSHYNPHLDTLVERAMMLGEQIDFSLNHHELNLLSDEFHEIIKKENIINTFI